MKLARKLVEELRLSREDWAKLEEDLEEFFKQNYTEGVKHDRE